MRKEGYYWIKFGSNWEVANWSILYNGWWLPGNDELISDDDENIHFSLDIPLQEPVECPVCGLVNGMHKMSCSHNRL